MSMKKSFNPNQSKLAKKIVFFRNTNKTISLSPAFSNTELSLSQKHLRFILDSISSLNDHVNNKIHHAYNRAQLLYNLCHVPTYWLLLNHFKEFSLIM